MPAACSDSAAASPPIPPPTISTCMVGSPWRNRLAPLAQITRVRLCLNFECRAAPLCRHTRGARPALPGADCQDTRRTRPTVRLARFDNSPSIEELAQALYEASAPNALQRIGLDPIASLRRPLGCRLYFARRVKISERRRGACPPGAVKVAAMPDTGPDLTRSTTGTRIPGNRLWRPRRSSAGNARRCHCSPERGARSGRRRCD